MTFIMRKVIRKRIILMACLVMTSLLVLLSACGEEEKKNGPAVQVFYLSSAETKVEPQEREKPTGPTEEQIKTLLGYLAETPDKRNVKSPLSMGFSILNADYKDGNLILNVDEGYTKLSSATEVLVRAAIVKTLLQADNVNRVQMQINGAQLVDGAGDLVGWMTADQFIYNDGSEINSYEQIRVKLYFANEDGNQLIAAYREKFYSTNISLERFVVDEILAGPSGKIAGLYRTVSPDVKILSVMTKDGICYVNLDSNFLTVVNNVSQEVAIYSIVNSLTELQGVNRVQILVDGEIPDSFENSIYEKNLDLVTTLEQ